VSRVRIDQGLDELVRVIQASKMLSERVSVVAGRYAAALRAGGTLLFCGNGGSAADAQHLAAEYVIRYAADRRPLAALALTTDSSILTAGGNDLGFDQVFARQIQALGKPSDILVVHSTSGESPNLLAAFRSARAIGVPTIAFLGKGGGALASQVDEALIVPSNETSYVQLIHMALEHLIVELVEGELFAR
jgi:D-sedoheptulose 7-phosphate isomerase